MKEDTSKELEAKEFKPVYSDLNLVYLSDGSNMPGQKFAEYFTSKLVRDYVVFGDKYVDKSEFKVGPEWVQQVVPFSERLICGSRGFFGLACEKYSEGVYDIGLGFCLQCENK